MPALKCLGIGLEPKGFLVSMQDHHSKATLKLHPDSNPQSFAYTSFYIVSLAAIKYLTVAVYRICRLHMNNYERLFVRFFTC